MTLTRIFPKSALGKARVDEAFQKEAQDVQTYALWDTDSQNLIKAAPGSVYLYRGWIMPTAEYANLEARVKSEGSTLFVSAAEYETSQFLPGWINPLQTLTPKTIIGNRATSISDLKEQANSNLEFPIVVKGVSKSLKDQWNAGMFIPDLGSFDQVVDYFLEHTSEREGIVFREFEKWQGPEFRTWWINNELKVTEPHPDFAKLNPVLTPDAVSQIAEELKPAVQNLNSPFITVDVVKTRQGEWRIVECGNGSVSQTITGTILSLI